MALAQSVYFTREHIENHRFDASSKLAEQAVYCLELVSELSDCGLDFQFKGGNSLLMILDAPRRFSIDVDIATDAPRDEIEGCLNDLIQKHQVFLSWEKRVHKTKPWLPISSYFVYFDSAVCGEKTSIMLDVQLRKSPYATHQKEVSCGELYKSNTKAVIPYPASIIGDKLLTLGPQTLGIPLGKGKQAQRLKHVYDVATLSVLSPSLQRIRDSFNGCLAQENSIQNKNITSEDVLKDTLSFCAGVLCHAVMPEEKTVADPTLKENITGLNPFAHHLFAGNYRWKDLQRDMSKAAVCIAAACIKSVSQQQFEAALGGEQSPDFSTKIIMRINDSAVQVMWEYISNWLGHNPFETAWRR